MADHLLQVPKNVEQYQVVAAFVPYSQELPVDIAALMERITVGTVTAIKYICTAQWVIAPRRVADDMFFYVIAGRGAMEVAGRRSRIGPGDLVHWRRGVTHAATTDAANPIQVISIHYTATLDSSIQLAEVVGFPDVFHLGPGHALEVLAHEACREYAFRPAGWRRGLEAMLVRLVLQVMRERAEDLKPEVEGRSLRDLQRVMPALNAMRDTVAIPLAIPLLARRCGLSTAQFRRVFIRAMGRSPVHYQRQLRLTESCRLLRETSDTIEAIATRVGYSESSFFSHTFRTAMGMPPGAYRDRREV